LLAFIDLKITFFRNVEKTKFAFFFAGDFFIPVAWTYQPLGIVKLLEMKK